MSKKWKNLTFDQKVNKLAKGIKDRKRTFEEKVEELKGQSEGLLDTVKKGLGKIDTVTLETTDDIKDILSKFKK